MNIDSKLLLGYLCRRVELLYDIIDRVPVFGKRYNEAVDELEEVEELIDIVRSR